MGERLSGKVAVVTGAGSGIGRAAAIRFGAEAARVVVNDVDPDSAKRVADEIEAAGGSGSAFPADVSDAAAVDALVAFATERYGRLDVMMNNAAAPIPGPIHEISNEDWRTVQSVTLDGVFFGTRAALRVMARQGSGSIINVASGAAVAGEPGLGAYGAAKAAVVNLTKTAAVENGPAGVRVNALLPGPIATPPMAEFMKYTPGGVESWNRQIPARRLGEPEEMANVALFLASDEASYVTGAAIIADGGISARTAAPRFDD